MKRSKIVKKYPELDYIYKINSYKINYNKIGGIIENFDNDNIENDDYWKVECKKYEKIPHILPKRKRVIAIGDIHGDWELTLKCLKIAGVINKDCTNEKDVKWTGGDTVVVQIGDQVDRCRPMAGKHVGIN